MKLPLKALDIPVMVLALSLTVLAAFGVRRISAGTARVLVRGPGGASWLFPLDAEETVRVAGPLGTTVVELSGGRVRVVSSPCENQICVAAGHLRAKGVWAACLPNRVFVVIEGDGGENGEPDVLAW
jgi:hypothetical protein